MTDPQPLDRTVRTLQPMAAAPEVGRWLSAMVDARRRTLRELHTVTSEMLDWRPNAPLNSMGTLLYHVALVEADWLVDDIQARPYPGWLRELLPYPDRDGNGRLIQVDGRPMAEHLERLDRVRRLVLGELKSMTPDEFHAVLVRERYDVSPAYILHHLLQHEAEHRAHIAWLRDTYPSSG